MKRRLEKALLTADFILHSSLGVHIYKYGDDLLQTHRRKRERARAKARESVRERVRPKAEQR